MPCLTRSPPRLRQVMDVRIIMDRNTRRSKGFAYIEMATRESIIPALSLAGQTLMGQSVMVKSSEARYKTLPLYPTFAFRLSGWPAHTRMGQSQSILRGELPRTLKPGQGSLERAFNYEASLPIPFT